MRLNMWMVANRLEGWDFQAYLKRDMPQVLHGARMVYAPNCIYMKQEGGNVRCSFNEEYITLMDIELKYAFEIVQGIFDAYDDWYVRVITCAKENDWQTITEEISYMVRNPVVFFDANNRVMGMYAASQEPLTVDEEWEYLSRHGFSSLRMMRIGRKNVEAAKKGWKFMLQHPTDAVKYSCLTTRIEKDGNTFGFISSLGLNRSFNDGDIKLLSLVTELLQPAFALYCSTSNDVNSSNCFLNILRGEEIDARTVELQMSYYRMKASDQFRIYVVRPSETTKESEGDIRLVKQNLLLKCVPTPFVEIDGQLVIITDANNGSGSNVDKALKEVCANGDFQAAKSLEFDTLRDACCYYRQALFAFRFPVLEREMLHCFYPHAVEYILTCLNRRQMICACQPEIYRLFKRKAVQSDDLMLSLELYLRYERSLSQAARRLFVHKNTLLYRIQKIEELCRCDLSEPYEREYILLSLRLLRAVSDERICQ